MAEAQLFEVLGTVMVGLILTLKRIQKVQKTNGRRSISESSGCAEKENVGEGILRKLGIVWDKSHKQQE